MDARADSQAPAVSGGDAVLALQRRAGNRAAIAALGRPSVRALAGELQRTVAVRHERGVSRSRVLARNGKKSKPAAAQMRTIRYRLTISGPLTDAELRDEFIRQYYAAASEQEVAKRRWMWKVASRGTTDAEVKRGYVDMRVTMSHQTDIAALDPQQVKEINDETDKRYWAAAHLPEGTRIDPHDEKAKKQWLGLRNAVLTEDKQLREIQSLPDDIKQVLFAGGMDAPALAREDFGRVIELARKLAQLSPEERQDYLQRVNASTTSLDELEASIERYVKFREQREQQSESFEAAATPLFGGEDLYSKYRDWLAWKAINKGSHNTQIYAEQQGGAGDMVDTYDLEEEQAYTALLAELKRQGFKSVADYQRAIEAFRVGFRTQAVNIALDLLARYEHLLFEQKAKLQAGGAGAIVQGIAATQAAALYKEAEEEERTARILHGAVDPEGKGANAGIYQEINRHRAAAAAAREQAEKEVIRGSGNNPLVAERKVDREKIAGLDEAGLRSYLLDVINAREKDVQEARHDFEDDPDRVFKLPELIGATMQVQGIQGDSVYARIINDYISDEQAKHLLSSIVKGILAVALAVLVPGGGWVAAAALVGGAALSAYQAYEELSEYEEQARDYRLHFLSEEPSLFWVVVAIAGAALDIGAATGAVVKASELLKESASGLKALEGALTDFSKGGELQKLLEQIEAVEGLRPEVKAALDRAARAADASRAAWKEALGAGSTLNMGANPDAIIPIFHALYSSVKRGVTSLTALRKDAQFLGIMREVTGLAGAERDELIAAFEEVKTLVRTGQKRGMDDATLLEYVDRWAANRANTTARTKLLDEMRAWKPLTAEQQQAMSALERQKGLVSSLYKEKEELLAEKEELLAAQRDSSTKSAENAERLHEINARLTELDPKSMPQKPGAHLGIGKIREAELAAEQAEEAARRAQLTLYDRIRAAAPSAGAREKAIDLWKLEKAEKAAKGIPVDGYDQVGKLIRSSGRLNADHIVSVREIVEMEGFKELTWQQQKAIVDMKENLIAMDAAANSSKNDVGWALWKNARSFYDQATIDVMKLREANVRKLIEDAIGAARAGAGKP